MRDADRAGQGWHDLFAGRGEEGRHDGGRVPQGGDALRRWQRCLALLVLLDRKRRSFALHEVVHEITLAMRPALRKQPITLHEDIPAELQLDSYPGPLGQVLMNLIANALAHAFGERSSGTITVQA